MKSISLCVCSDAGVSQSQDDSIVGTKQCRHSVAIMPIPGSLSSSSPDLLHPAASSLDFTNPSGKTSHHRSTSLATCIIWCKTNLTQYMLRIHRLSHKKLIKIILLHLIKILTVIHFHVIVNFMQLVELKHYTQFTLKYILLRYIISITSSHSGLRYAKVCKIVCIWVDLMLFTSYFKLWKSSTCK